MHRHQIEQEIAELKQRYGAPLHRTVPIKGQFNPIKKADRYGEVCMVVRRANGKLLTARKTFYPTNAYRLLTGGIGYGEKIYDALLRETAEETGLAVEVKRFLAMVDYTREEQPPTKANTPIFTTFAFLLDEMGGSLVCADPDERVEDFREVTIAELPLLAQQLQQLTANFDHEISGRWHDWGRFRAVIHYAVYEAFMAKS
jgi:NAD+ diphosphatase